MCVYVPRSFDTAMTRSAYIYVILLAHSNSYSCRQPVQIAKVNGRQNVAAAVCTVPLPEAEAQRKAQAEKIRLNATQLQFGPTPLATAVRHRKESFGTLSQAGQRNMTILGFAFDSGDLWRMTDDDWTLLFPQPFLMLP